MQTDDSIIRLSGDDIIEQIKESRNDLITRLRQEKPLREFLSEHYGKTDVSNIKIEFIRKALKELMASPLELSHYGSLVLEIRKSGSMSISKSHNRYFVKDIENAIKNYVF